MSSSDAVDVVTASYTNDNQLKTFVERIERLTEEKKALMRDISDVFKEVESAGFNPKVLRRVLQLRQKKEHERNEEEELVELYLRALR